jgi:hypothetical protein
MHITVTGEVWHWRGPAPFHFVSLSAEAAEEVRDVAGAVTYGWGMIPITATCGGTQWTTSMFAKNGTYVVPLKDIVRKTEGIEIGDVITVDVELPI